MTVLTRSLPLHGSSGSLKMPCFTMWDVARVVELSQEQKTLIFRVFIENTLSEMEWKYRAVVVFRARELF